MKIARNGQDYELTAEELVTAYFEQQFNFDLSDCRDEVSRIIEDDLDERTYVEAAKKVLNSQDLLADCAMDMRRNIDKYDMEWSYARDEAVRSIVCRVQSELL